MANGGGLDEQQWQQLEKPLLAIDPIINEFAAANGLAVTRNQKDWPERSIVWNENGVRCLIQLYLASEKLLTYNLWLCASQDRGSERFWKQESPVRNQPVAAFSGQLAELLGEGREKLRSWSDNPSVLGYATGIGGKAPDR